MANGSSGAAVTGLVIGVILATQAVDFGASDEGGDGVDDTAAAQSTPNPDEPAASDEPTASDEPAASGQGDEPAYPTSVEGGQAGPPSVVETDGTITSTGRRGRTIALTFSTGPDPGSTAQVLDLLDEHGVDATFCVLGANAREQPELIRRIAAEGHALCDRGLGQEIGPTLDAIIAAAPAATVPFFRAPGGDFSPRLNDIAASYGQVPLGWSIDIADSAGPGTRAIVDSVMDRVEPGAVVLLRDGGQGRSGTVAVLEDLIIDLHDAGYELVIPAP